MNQKVKKKWVEALRSGEYIQGKHHLRTTSLVNPQEHAYCCLGVLCDLFLKEKNLSWDTDESNIKGYSSAPIKEVDVWAGIDSKSFIREGNHVFFKLMSMNDVDNLSFNAIANYIENNM